jgi:hypothetical protein
MAIKKTTLESGLIKTESDGGFYIERDGNRYSVAIDPENSGRTYTETDTPIPQPDSAQV